MQPLTQRDNWPSPEWQKAEPAAAGMDAGKLAELDDLIAAQYSHITGIAVVRKGYLVHEYYPNGCGPQDARHVASVTKSVISALVGIAIDAGYLQSVDQKVLDFFPEYTAQSGDFIKQAVTIRHLLTMTAPFAWKNSGRREAEPLDRLRRQRDWVPYILDLMGRNGTIGEFQYSTASTHLLSALLTRATGMCARAFANERLFRPLGMREIPEQRMISFLPDQVFGDHLSGWIADPAGNTVGGWGLTLTPRDMARFGFLYLNHGAWNGQQVISEAWVEASTAPNPAHYGYLWWLGEEGGMRTFAALGSGGNLIYCLPEKDLVVAAGAKIVRKPRDRRLLFDKCILPALLD